MHRIVFTWAVLAVLAGCSSALQKPQDTASPVNPLKDRTNINLGEIVGAVFVPNSRMTRISGRFLTKVFEGPYKNIRNWVKEMETYVDSCGKTIRKLYFFSTMCPNCAKFYGKKYVVLVAQID